MSVVYNINMAKTYQPERAFSGRVRQTYDPRIDSGTSGAESSDLNPEQAYDVDLRRVAGKEEGVAAKFGNLRGEGKQNSVAKFLRAAKAAGRRLKSQAIKEPTSANEGASFGPVGSTAYAQKPEKPNFGNFFF